MTSTLLSECTRVRLLVSGWVAWLTPLAALWGAERPAPRAASPPRLPAAAAWPSGGTAAARRLFGGPAACLLVLLPDARACSCHAAWAARTGHAEPVPRRPAHPRQEEMLGSVRDQAGGTWSVLVLDAVTTKVLSNVAGVSDIMDYGVSRELVVGAEPGGRARAVHARRSRQGGGPAKLLAADRCRCRACPLLPASPPLPPDRPFRRCPGPPCRRGAVVEDLGKRREPLPQLVGVYFLSPTDDNIRQLVRDFSLASMPQYKAAHVFFSSKPAVQHLAAIRECAPLVGRLRTLKEVGAPGWVGVAGAAVVVVVVGGGRGLGGGCAAASAHPCLL